MQVFSFPWKDNYKKIMKTQLELTKEMNKLKTSRNRLHKVKKAKSRSILQVKIDAIQNLITETYTKKEAEELGIIGFEGLGFVNPKSAFKKINKQILELIKAGNLVYRKPWRDGYKIKGVTYGPQNYVSQNPYSGYNAWLISFMNATSGERNEHFLTAKQVKDRGGKLKKNATPYPVHAFIKGEKEEKNKKTGEKETFTYTGWVEYVVYPIDHTEGVKPIKRKAAKVEQPVEIIVDAETIISNMPKAPSVRNGGDKAYYTPSSDYVQMPAKKAFKSQKQYYSTLFHELVHSTGHSKRLNRGNDTRKRDGSVEDKKAYAFEELVAELGAAYLCGVCEIDYYTMNNTAAYLKGWARVLTDNLTKDHSFLFRAVYAAAKAAKYIIGETLVKTNNKKPFAITKGVKQEDIEKEFSKRAKEENEISKKNTQLTEKEFNARRKELEKYINDEDETVFDEVENLIQISGQRKLTAKEVKYINQNCFLPSGFEFNNEVTLVPIKSKSKNQLDLFPELSGTEKNHVAHFIREYVKLHNTVVTYEQAEKLLEQLQKSIKAKEIRKGHPFGKDIDRIQANLLKLCKHTATKGDTQVIINHFGLKRYNEIIGGKLEGFMIPFIAAAAGKIIEIAIEKKLDPSHGVHGAAHNKKTKKGLNGIEMPGFIRADHKPTAKPEGVFRLPGEIGKFLQDLQFYKGMIVLTGDPHAGKTEVAYQIADSFATMGEDIAIYSLEQGGLESKDTAAAIDRNIAPGNKKHLYINGEAPKGLQSIKEAAKHFRVIIIDSFQKLNVPSTMLDSLRHEHPNVFFIVIFQQNGEGGTRGGVSADYDTPIKIKVHKVDPTTFKYNYAELVKNRGNSLNVKYMLATKKTVPAVEPVVEKKVKK